MVPSVSSMVELPAVRGWLTVKPQVLVIVSGLATVIWGCSATVTRAAVSAEPVSSLVMVMR